MRCYVCVIFCKCSPTFVLGFPNWQTLKICLQYQTRFIRSLERKRQPAFHVRYLDPMDREVTVPVHEKVARKLDCDEAECSVSVFQRKRAESPLDCVEQEVNSYEYMCFGSEIVLSD